MIKKTIIISITLVMLAGCQATPKSLYTWGNYEDALFANFHEPEAREAELTEYLAFIQSTPKHDLRFGPGLYAEAGTFMLHQGNIPQAIHFYQLEANNWPASKTLMDTLVKNLKARNNIEQEANSEGASND